MRKRNFFSRAGFHISGVTFHISENKGKLKIKKYWNDSLGRPQLYSPSLACRVILIRTPCSSKGEPQKPPYSDERKFALFHFLAWLHECRLCGHACTVTPPIHGFTVVLSVAPAQQYSKPWVTGRTQTTQVSPPTPTGPHDPTHYSLPGKNPHL